MDLHYLQRLVKQILRARENGETWRIKEIRWQIFEWDNCFFELKRFKVNVIVSQLRSNKEKQLMNQKLWYSSPCRNSPVPNTFFIHSMRKFHYSFISTLNGAWPFLTPGAFLLISFVAFYQSILKWFWLQLWRLVHSLQISHQALWDWI